MVLHTNEAQARSAGDGNLLLIYKLLFRSVQMLTPASSLCQVNTIRPWSPIASTRVLNGGRERQWSTRNGDHEWILWRRNKADICPSTGADT